MDTPQNTNQEMVSKGLQNMGASTSDEESPESGGKEKRAYISDMPKDGWATNHLPAKHRQPASIYAWSK